MRFTLEIQSRGAAFEDDATYELARILRSVADSLEAYGPTSATGAEYAVRDINGNTCGRYALTTEED
jgi:hypothetical protein